MFRIGDVLLALHLRIHSVGCIPRAGARAGGKKEDLNQIFYAKTVFRRDY